MGNLLVILFKELFFILRRIRQNTVKGLVSGKEKRWIVDLLLDSLVCSIAVLKI